MCCCCCCCCLFAVAVCSLLVVCRTLTGFLVVRGTFERSSPEWNLTYKNLLVPLAITSLPSLGYEALPPPLSHHLALTLLQSHPLSTLCAPCPVWGALCCGLWGACVVVVPAHSQPRLSASLPPST